MKEKSPEFPTRIWWPDFLFQCVRNAACMLAIPPHIAAPAQKSIANTHSLVLSTLRARIAMRAT